jgi:hypothetical protein
MPTALVLVLSPGPTDDEVTLIAITIGAESRSELTKRKSSTACRFPGDAFVRYSLASRGKKLRNSKTDLLVQYKFDTFLPLSRSGHPYLNSELLCGQNIPQERLGLTFAQYDARETSSFASATEIFNDGVRAEDLRSDVVRIWAISTIVFAPIKEANRSCFWGFLGKLGVECDEARV